MCTTRTKWILTIAVIASQITIAAASSRLTAMAMNRNSVDELAAKFLKNQLELKELMKDVRH